MRALWALRTRARLAARRTTAPTLASDCAVFYSGAAAVLSLVVAVAL